MASQQTARMEKLLQQALLTLLAKFPFEKITIQQIADEAMVNRTTIYAHYEDKFALLDATLQVQFAANTIKPEELITKPFATLATLCKGALSRVVERQRDDMAFQQAMMQLFFHELKRTDLETTSLPAYLLIWRMKAVMHWVRETHQPYNLYTAGSVLDQQIAQANERLNSRI